MCIVRQSFNTIDFWTYYVSVQLFLGRMAEYSEDTDFEFLLDLGLFLYVVLCTRSVFFVL